MLSVIWAIFGALWADYAIFMPIERDYSNCIANPETDLHFCDRAHDLRLSAARTYSTQFTLEAALVPIPIAWLVAYGLVALVRWIRRGFTSKA